MKRGRKRTEGKGEARSGTRGRVAEVNDKKG